MDIYSLISSPYLEDRITAAASRELPVEAQDFFICDEIEVQEALIKNPTLSRDSVTLLAQDRNVDVRFLVAQRESLDADVVVALSMDEDGEVSDAAKQRNDYVPSLNAMVLRCGVTPNLTPEITADLLLWMPDLWAWNFDVEIVGWVQPTED